MKSKFLVNVKRYNTTYTHDFWIKCFFKGHNFDSVTIGVNFFQEPTYFFQTEQVLIILGLFLIYQVTMSP